MENFEINLFASGVTSDITSDLRNGIYKEINGSLSVLWTADELNAYAESTYATDRAPNHKISISYELAQQLYRSSEKYHEFMLANEDSDLFKAAFLGFNPMPKLPEFDPAEGSIKNMFLGGITWIYFHELGHLKQEHGYIRNIFSNNKSASSHIEESFDNKNNPLEGRDAAISHATEFAADFEAIDSCITELIRHFFAEEEFKKNEISEDSRNAFFDTLFLFVCGLSCTMYIFYGDGGRELSPYPRGSHPEPLRRLEVCIPHLIEKLDMFARAKTSMHTDRAKLTSLCNGAAYSFAIFWQSLTGNPNTEIIKGIKQDPHLSSYWREIIAAWDELEPHIMETRWYGSKFGLLRFSNEFRVMAFGNQMQAKT